MSKQLTFELTWSEIARQDLVDNAIHQVIQSLAPAGVEVPWDIEVIGAVRAVIGAYLVEDLKLMTGQEFYPSLEERADYRLLQVAG